MIRVAFLFVLLVFVFFVGYLAYTEMTIKAQETFRSWSSDDLREMGLYGEASPELGVRELCEKYGRLEYNCSAVKN